MPEKGKIAQAARAAGVSVPKLLTMLFEEHKTVSKVARALNVAQPSVTIALWRECLEIKVTLVKRVRQNPGLKRWGEPPLTDLPLFRPLTDSTTVP
jgi:hypothetical protein